MNMQDNEYADIKLFNDHTIYVADIPIKMDQYCKPCPIVDEDFLRHLFQDFNIVQSPDSVTINVEIGENGYPYSYAYIILKNHEDVKNAISNLNYTKINNAAIRLIQNDLETRDIIKSNQGNLFIKNLDPDIEVSQLHDSFENFGEIVSCKIPTNEISVPKFDNPKETETKYVSKGYAYVQFRNPDDAKQAMIDLKDATINGRPVEIQPFCRRQGQNPDAVFTVCQIQNLPDNFDEKDLYHLFSQFGKPKAVIVDKNKKYGICSMSNHEEAVNAVENLDGKEIEGKTVVCFRALTNSEKYNK